MIRFLRAFAWLRWRLLVNGIKGGKRRDRLERFSRIAAVAAPVLLFLMMLGLALSFAVLGLVGGWLAGTGKAEPAIVLVFARLLLLVVLAVIVVVPLGRAAYGAMAGYTRLLLLPIPRSALHLVEVLAGLADPWVALALPALVLFAVGLAAAGRVGAALIALCAAAGIALILTTLGSLVTFLMTWFMRSRRRGELFTLVFVLLLSIGGMVPALLSDRFEQRSRATQRHERPAPAVRIAQFDETLPLWTRALPSELFGRSIQLGFDGRTTGAGLALVVLFFEAVALYALSAAAHGKLLDSAASEGTRRRAFTQLRVGRRLPGLTPAASAVALAQARTALRSVRGRMVLLLPPAIVALFGVVVRRIPQEFPGGEFAAAHAYALLGFGMIFSLYALQGFSMNQFASDRAGLTLQFLAPIADEDLVRGKAAGCGIVFGSTVLLCLLCALPFAGQGSPLAWLSVLLGGAAAYMLLTPVAALLSAVFPVAADMSKTGSGGNPHGLSMLVGMLLVLVLSGPPGLILGLVNEVLGRPGLALVLMSVWTIVAAAVALPLLRLAARAVAPRRENLALVAQGR